MAVRMFRNAQVMARMIAKIAMLNYGRRIERFEQITSISVMRFFLAIRLQGAQQADAIF